MVCAGVLALLVLTSCRYLVHSMRKGMSGLGDRIRGMLFATRLAAASHRVILFTWKDDPAEPQTFLSPAGSIDWRVQDTGYQQALHDPSHSNHLALDMYTWKQQQQETLERVKQGWLLNQTDIQYITIFTNERAEVSCTGCQPLSAPLEVQDSSNSAGATSTAACLFRMLFKPRWVLPGCCMGASNYAVASSRTASLAGRPCLGASWYAASRV